MGQIKQANEGASNPFRALRNYNFRLFWLGQLVSLIGAWMQGLAQGWLILVLADPATRQAVFSHGGDAAAAVQSHASSAAEHTANLYSGFVNFAGGLPVLLLTLFAGVIIDRVNKRKLIMITQSTAMMCALVTGTLIHERIITINELLALALILGISMAADMPSRQSFVPSLVPQEDVPSAVALNSSMFNSARALGPAIAGYLLARHVSLENCFFCNAASYVAVLIALGLMRGKNLGAPRPRSDGDNNVIANLRAGFSYVRHDHTALNVVLLVGVFGMFGFSFNVLIPPFVKYTLLPHSIEAAQIRAFGLLETVRGLGALAGAISVAVFASMGKQKLQLIIGSLLSTACLVVFAFARDMSVAYGAMAVVAFGFVLCFATCNTLLQLTVPDELRGRVMAIYSLMFVGTGPIGSLMAGSLAAHIGARPTIFFFAMVSLVAALFACFRPGGIRSLKVAARKLPPPLRQEPLGEGEPDAPFVGGQ
ncbi:MAG: MFS transporter [Capsulimonadaceae bacterium]|nr:MFS transporter [Capsulimonadaceae bacterium]